MPQGCETPLLGGLLPAHRAPRCRNSAASGFKADFLHPQPLYPIHSYKGVPAVLQVSAKPKDVSQQLIALICAEWRVQPTLGHATSWLGWGGLMSPRPLEELYIAQPAPSRGRFGVLELFWGAGVVLGGWARSLRKCRTGQTSHGLALMWAGAASPGLCRIQPCSRAAPRRTH